ncbi:MAG TPA: hypothetical protein GYA07_00040 [Verrucomicrobia bacterium]|nr:hypothetical protein [Verrucomicrobiota bacterium]HOP96338.1 alginate lyase family protein [Verrucomicrobiota bacterium]HPU55115.1 alginate lyase family protein [Verrucomicrobiota bacterium]
MNGELSETRRPGATTGVRSRRRRVPAAAAVLLAGSLPVLAAQAHFSASPPRAGPNDVGNFVGASFDADNAGGSGINENGGPHNGTANDRFTCVAHGRPLQGQTFITGANPNGYDLVSFSVRVAGYSNNIATGDNGTAWDLDDDAFFRIRIGEVRDGTNYFPLSHQYASVGGPGNPGQGRSANGPGVWMTFELDYPVRLDPNTLYGVDLGPVNGSSSHFEWLGIRDGATNGNPFASGSAYISGPGYFEIIPIEADRVFIAQLKPAEAPFAFAHPGALHSEADFIRMSNKVAQAAQPWKGSYDMLTVSPYAQLNWRPAPVEYIVRGGRGQNYTRSQQDAAAVYQLALRWRISGDTAYADRAVFILNAWANTLRGVRGDSNQSLAGGICGAQFACAAEMLSAYPGWVPADRRKFKDMMMRVFYTANDDFLHRHHDNCSTHYRLNWDTANMVSMLAIGVLCDNKAVFDQALDYFYRGDINGNIQNAVWFIHDNGLGQTEEAGRDQGHNNGGMNFLARFCQVAWNQGHDLFGYDNNRLLRGIEYLAKYNLFYDVPYVPHRTCDMRQTEAVVSEAGRGALDPMFELIHHHYVNIKGLSAPFSTRAAELLRPEPGPNTSIHPSQVDWFGFGTLTYTREPFEGDVPPSGLTAKVRGSRVLLNWWGSAYATNYVIKRATTRGGPYTTLATIPAHEDRMFWDTAPADGTAYYAVSALTPSGETANSGEVAVSLQPRLIAHLKFDETSGAHARDASGNGADGVLSAGGTWMAGRQGGAVHLARDRKQYVALPAGITTNLNDFTIATWVRLSSLSSWMRIWDFGFGSPLARVENTPTRYMFLSPRAGSGVVRFAITGSGGALEQQIDGTAPLPVGVWKHVAVTLSGSNGVLYVDGVPVGTNSQIHLTPAQLGHTTQNWLGRSQYADPYLDGMLDDFRIYDRALTPAQIAALAASTDPSVEAAAPRDVPGRRTSAASGGDEWRPDR